MYLRRRYGVSKEVQDKIDEALREAAKEPTPDHLPWWKRWLVWLYILMILFALFWGGAT